MLETLRNAFKVKDIRNRILFTFLMLIVIRLDLKYRFRALTVVYLSHGLNQQQAD